MSVSVSMPQLGESVTEGTVTRWLKKEGERVEADEPLLEVSTDKVDTEIPSPVSGILRGITVAEDETVAVGAELAVIDETADGEAPAAAPAAEASPHARTGRGRAPRGRARLRASAQAAAGPGRPAAAPDYAHRQPPRDYPPAGRPDVPAPPAAAETYPPPPPPPRPATRPRPPPARRRRPRVPPAASRRRPTTRRRQPRPPRWNRPPRPPAETGFPPPRPAPGRASRPRYSHPPSPRRPVPVRRPGRAPGHRTGNPDRPAAAAAAGRPPASPLALGWPTAHTSPRSCASSRRSTAWTLRP